MLEGNRLRSLWLASILLVIALPVLAVDEIVTVEQGQLEGTEVSPGILAWYSIPYAQPPVGALRFAEAQEPLPWEGVRDATSTSPRVCTQFLFGGPIGEEDCLVLTVTAPADADDAPVLIWIHGGGMTNGGSGFIADPYQAGQLDAVIVTINYRLGALAAYASPALRLEHPAGSAGNNSLLDAIAALRWVHENIAAFGGDPDHITIEGHSAGASLVAYMLASPLTQGMIWQAFFESPGYPDRIATIDGDNGSSDFLLNALDRGAEIEAAAGCNFGTAAQRLTCMRGLPAQSVRAAGETRTHVLAPGVPETWPNVDGYALFLQPAYGMMVGYSKDVRMIGGFTRHDISTWWTSLALADQAALETQIDATFHPYWASELKDRYPASEFAADGPFPTAAKSAWVAILTDVVFACSTDGFLEAAASATGRTADVRAHSFEREHPVHGAFHSMAQVFWKGPDFAWLTAPLPFGFGYTADVFDWAAKANMMGARNAFIKGQSMPVWWPTLPSTIKIGNVISTHADGREGRCDELRQIGLLL